MQTDNPSPLRAVINADDLGISPAVNAAIFDLMRRGRITSATILANGSALQNAVDGLREFPQCSFGVHLNVDEFASLTRHPGFRGHLDSNGYFRGSVRHVPIDRYFRDAVVAEWTAQVDSLLQSGVPVSHLDSHHHVHTVPQLFFALKRVQQHFGIQRVRLSRNLEARPTSLTSRAKKAAWNFALRKYVRTRTTDACTSFAVFLEIARKRRPAVQTIELMAHPGHPRYESETHTLAEAWERELAFPVTLQSYRDI